MSYISDNLIAHYKMNDNAASATVIDDTHKHNGTYKDAGGNENTSNGAVQGRINGALDFDHANSEYVEIADHDDFSPGAGVAGSGTPFSISAWVYMHDATNFWIASKGRYNVDGEWVFFVGAVDKVCAWQMDESVDDCYIGRKYDTALTSYENQWIHLVLTCDGGSLSSGIRIYLNRKRVDDTDYESNAASFVAVENLAHAVWIGQYNGAYANGLIDNVMFWKIELTQEQIDILYNAGSGTEIVAELDETIHPRRGNLSRFPLRRRY